VAEVRPPKIVVYDYGMFKALPGTASTAGVHDTFFGPRDKAYVDFHCRNATRVRGTQAYFYVKDDQNRRIDGDRPLSDAPEEGRIMKPEGAEQDPFARYSHAGFALYGENVQIGERIDSATREVYHDWPYLDPILVRGILYDMEHEQEADERGSIYVRRCSFDLARVLCEREWDFQPRPGDVVRFTKFADRYMDIEDVTRDEHRWGGDGWFAVYKMMLVKSSKFEPQRKIADRKLSGPPPNTADPNPGDLS
jgi:hypothetical protein